MGKKPYNDREEEEGSMNLRIKSLFRERPALLWYQILIKFSGKPNPIRLWDDDQYFNELMKKIKRYTLVDKKRCFMIYQLAKQVSSFSGDAVEVGVYKGGTAKLLAELFKSQNKALHLFDTFAGVPPSDVNRDIHKQGDFRDTSLENIKAYLRDYKNIYYYQGTLPATAKPIENLSFCLVHIDVDIYKSVMDCCEFFYPRMERSGIIIFDDYGFLTCPGAKMAVDDFFSDKIEKPCYLQSGQCIVIKL